MSRVERIFVYPIKSCRGIEVTAAALTPRGLEHDRRYMLVDADGRFLTQRRHQQMALIVPRFSEQGLIVSAPGCDDLLLPAGFDSTALESCTVRIWDDSVEATLAAPDINIWFSEFMGFACGLVYMADDQHRAIPNPAAAFDDEVSFADGAPLLLLSDASLDDLNRRLDRPVTIEHFRPNLVVSAGQPHAEDGWSSVTAGEAVLDVAWPCSRCILTTIDPVTGKRDVRGEPMRTLNGYRRRDGRVCFGQNLIPRSGGTIRRGDSVSFNAIIES